MAIDSDEVTVSARRLWEATDTGVVIHDADGSVVDATDPAREILGVTGELIGRDHDEFALRDADGTRLDSEETPFARMKRRGEAISDEQVAVETPEGRRWLSVSGVPRRDDDGRFDGAVMRIEDVTERRERERELEESRTVLDQVTTASDDSVWLYDADFSTLLFIDDTYEEIWGQPADRLREDPTAFLEAIHPEDRERVQAAMERLAGGEAIHIEIRVNAAEDYGRWVSIHGEPVCDETGEVIRIAGFTRDVTDRVEYQRRLEDSQRQFEAVFNDPQLLVALLDPDGTVRRINETAISHAVADHEAIAGTPFRETSWWNHDPDLQEALDGWIERASDGEYVTYGAVHELPDGTEMHVEGVVRPVTDGEGTVRSLLASARDVTDRIERERALEASNERLEQFAYVASHDLQEPLRTIANYTELLAEEYGDALEGEAAEFLDVIVTGSRRMQSMLNGLLEYSRVTTRGGTFEPVDTDALVADVADSLDHMLETHDGSLRWDSLPTVTVDDDQLGQVFQNLISNALEHADEPVTIDVRAIDGGDHYRFEVADDGPGIQENRQEKIFRIFKSGTSYQTSAQAKGLGLAICDNIVRRHDGEIWVDSEPGEGATFMFTIPKGLGDRSQETPNE